MIEIILKEGEWNGSSLALAEVTSIHLTALWNWSIVANFCKLWWSWHEPLPPSPLLFPPTPFQLHRISAPPSSPPWAPSLLQQTLIPMYSFGKYWKWKFPLMGFVYRFLRVLKALWIILSETIKILRKLHKTNIFGMPPKMLP